MESTQCCGGWLQVWKISHRISAKSGGLALVSGLGISSGLGFRVSPALGVTKFFLSPAVPLATLRGGAGWGVSFCAGGQLQPCVQPQVSRPGGAKDAGRARGGLGHSPGSFCCSMPHFQVSGDSGDIPAAATERWAFGAAGGPSG